MQIKHYLSLVKFSHTVFAMPFAIIGFLLGLRHTNQPFHWAILLGVVLCMVFARTAAMAFNRYIDSDIDAQNSRTKNREIPAGILSPKKVLLLTVASSMLFMLSTFFINDLVFYLSPIALAVILGYSYTKRFTALAHLVLGIGLGLAPIGAYLSVTGEFNLLLPILFSLITLFWVAGFDILYALQDEQFDKEHHLKSIPAFLGTKKALIVSAIFHLMTAFLIIYIGLSEHFSLFYWIGALIFIGILLYEHLLIKPNDLSRINMAFATLNSIGSVVYSFFVILELYLN